MTFYETEVLRHREAGCEIYEDAWREWPADLSLTGTGCVLYDHLRDAQKAAEARGSRVGFEYALAVRLDATTNTNLVVAIIPKNLYS